MSHKWQRLSNEKIFCSNCLAVNTLVLTERIPTHPKDKYKWCTILEPESDICSKEEPKFVPKVPRQCINCWALFQTDLNTYPRYCPTCKGI